MKTQRANIDMLRRRNARLLAGARKGMQSAPADFTLPEGAIQAVVSFKGHSVEKNGDGDVTTLTLLECSIQTRSGDTAASDATVYLEGPTAKSLSRDRNCLKFHAFSIRCVVMERQDQPSWFDMIAFAGTSPITKQEA